ncbi:hypothetical protein NQZ79_g1973 [Umbelopsis isabellina]|nr:hypothetical protein NQZ79_g1973 [Umbelopsis isabellina]
MLSRSTFSRFFKGATTSPEPGDQQSSDSNLRFKPRPYSIYLATFIFNADGNILVTPSGHIPTMPIIQKDPAVYDNFLESSTEFSWAVKASMDWADHDQVESTPQDARSSCSDEGLGTSNDSTESNSSSLDSSLKANCAFSIDDSRATMHFREGLMTAASELRQLTGCQQLGTFHDHIVKFRRLGIKMIVTVQYCPRTIEGPYGCTSFAGYNTTQLLKWVPIDKIHSLYREPHQNSEIWTSAQHIYNSRRAILNPGLYLGLFHVQSTPNGLGILVDRRHKNLLPCSRIRKDTRLSKAEWQWIQSLSRQSNSNNPHAGHINLSVAGAESKVPNFASVIRQAQASLSKSTGFDVQLEDIFAEDTIIISKTKKNSKSSFECATLSADASLASEYCNQQDRERQINENGSFNTTFSDILTKVNNIGLVDYATEVPIRIIVIIQPMATTGKDFTGDINAGYRFYPFSLFDVFHHSMYNSAIYNPLRKSMLHLQNVYTSIRLHFDSDTEPEHFDNSSTISDRSWFATDASTILATQKITASIAPSSTTSKQSRDHALSKLATDMANLTSKWLQISWTYRMISFDRKRQFDQAKLDCASMNMTPKSTKSLKVPGTRTRTTSATVRSLEISSNLSPTLKTK